MKVKVKIHLHNLGETREVEVENGNSKKVSELLNSVCQTAGITVEPGSVIAKNGEVIEEEETILREGDYISTHKGKLKGGKR